MSAAFVDLCQKVKSKRDLDDEVNSINFQIGQYKEVIAYLEARLSDAVKKQALATSTIDASIALIEQEAVKKASDAKTK